MKQALFLIAMVCTAWVNAQDVYHNGLNTGLQSDFSLPAGTWLLPNTETATFTGSTTYGGTSTNFTATGQPFSQARRIAVTAGQNSYSSGHLYKNSAAIATGNRCLLVMWLRSSTPNSKVNFFAENATTYDKEVFFTAKLSDQWKRYLIPFESKASYATNALNVGVHLGWITQEVEVGGVAMLNYTNTVAFTQLPNQINNDTYDGIEPNAPWRAEAAASIEQLRKANLKVVAKDAAGNPASATLKIEMLQHEFGFGTAVVSNLFNGGSQQNNVYEQKLTNLDGKGHGFNEVVFESDLKWDGWEEGWFSTKPAIVSDLAWFANKNIKMRGHNLVWPSWIFMPDDMLVNKNNPTYLLNRVRNRIKDILTYPGIGGTACIDWDALNEITENNDLANALAGTPGYPTGREIYPEIFKLADSIAPETKLYLNDYVAIENADSDPARIDVWKSRIAELRNANAPVEGIGFQGHFGAFPTGIPRVKAIYDDFYNSYGLEAKVTEYDISLLVPPQTQAQYMRDILMLTYAHPSMKAFLMWGFWDGAHWLGNAPIYNKDWTLKPSGEAFIDQVYRKWWTDTTTIATNGGFDIRGFRGTYKITASCPQDEEVQFITLDGDKTVEFTLMCLSDASDLDAAGFRFVVAPVPAVDQLNIQWQHAPEQVPARLQVFDQQGRIIWEQKQPTIASSGNLSLPVGNWPNGKYQISFDLNGKVWARNFVVAH